MKLLFALAVSLAMTVGSAIAQQDQDIVNFAAIEAVQKDLGVSDEVARKLTSLSGEYRAAIQTAYQDAGLNPRFNPNQLTAEQRLQHVEIGRKLNNQFLPKTKELLSLEQFTRLQQISFQRRLYYNAPLALLLPETAAELMVTDEQKQSLSALRLEFTRGLVFGKGSEVVEKARKHSEEYKTKAVEVLTAEQKKTLSKMSGDEFDLSKLINRAPPGKGN